MATYWETTGMLLHRRGHTYTDGERGSVAYLHAFWDEIDSVGPFAEKHQ